MSQQSVIESMRQQIQIDFAITKPAGIQSPSQPTARYSVNAIPSIKANPVIGL